MYTVGILEIFPKWIWMASGICIYCPFIIRYVKGRGQTKSTEPSLIRSRADRSQGRYSDYGAKSEKGAFDGATSLFKSQSFLYLLYISVGAFSGTKVVQLDGSSIHGSKIRLPLFSLGCSSYNSSLKIFCPTKRSATLLSHLLHEEEGKGSSICCTHD